MNKYKNINFGYYWEVGLPIISISLLEVSKVTTINTFYKKCLKKYTIKVLRAYRNNVKLR